MAINVNADIEKDVNFVEMHLNETFLKNVVIQSDEELRVVCKIIASPEFIYEYKKTVLLKKGKNVVEFPELTLNDDFYRQECVEAREGQIQIDILDAEDMTKVLGFFQSPIHIQPYFHWKGDSAAHTLCAFMQPNDRLVATVIKRAGEIANQDNRTLHGYQGKDKEDVKKQVGYIYQAIQEIKIHYISSPSSFENHGQKIRIPHQVLNEELKQGSCLDLSILYASCLEAIALHSMFIVLDTHAFVGVWLEKKMFDKVVMQRSELDSHLWTDDNADILPVECTTCTDDRGYSFSDSVYVGMKNIGSCKYLVDVARARRCNINPVYAFADNQAAANETEINIKDEFSKDNMTRLDILRQQAMDISVRNRLLHHANGNTPEIKIAINANDFLQSNLEMIPNFPIEVAQAKKNGVLHSLYKLSRQSLREKGKNNLYLSINEIIWCQEENKKKKYSAPIYLCPAEIYKNRRGEYQVRLFVNGIRLNPVLKQMLIQNDLDANALMDAPKEKYHQQMKLLEELIQIKAGWSLRLDVAKITTYPILNEAVWKALSSKALKKHEIVKSILEGQMLWDFTEKVSPTSSEIIYPFEVDSSQREILQSAFVSKAQVVTGAAGSGKSQTVANIMLNALYQGKKVLFVSEKVSALEVVHHMIDEKLQGIFNLIIINGKHDDKNVRNQIQKTLDKMLFMSQGDNDTSEEYNETLKEYEKCKKYFEHYDEIMKKKYVSGMSLEQLIKKYEDYRACSIDLKLDESCMNISFNDACDAISLFANAMENRGAITVDSDAYIQIAENDDQRDKLRLKVQNVLDLFEKVYDSVNDLASVIGLGDITISKSNINNMLDIADELVMCPSLGCTREEIFDSTIQLNEKADAYKQKVIDALEAYAHSIKLPVVKELNRKKAEQLIKNIRGYKTRNIIRRYDNNPEDVLEEIKLLNLHIDEEGEAVLMKSDEGQGSYQKYKKYLQDVEVSINRFNISQEQKMLVNEAIDKILQNQGDEIKMLAETVVDVFETYNKAFKEIKASVIKNEAEFVQKYPDKLKIELFKVWLSMNDSFVSIRQQEYEKICSDVRKQGLGSVIEQIEQIAMHQMIDSSEILDAFCKSWYRTQIDQIQQDSGLGQFSRIRYNNEMNQYLKKEKELQDMIVNIIIEKQLRRLPNIHEGISENPEFGYLQRMVRKNSMIREFFEKTPNMLYQMCACMMMDPVAVAEYVPEEFPKFDLVIIDEGSQMPTYNALVPIARANKCIIFGDEKQLKPMDYFMKKRMDQYGASEEADSILTDAICASFPQKMLRFHYRSENESLIAFSNNRYYQNQIITFPSSDTSIRGVAYEYVEDGIYDKGGKRVNEQEAEKVIDKIEEIYDDLSIDAKDTIGVITLNINQRDLIQSKLMDRFLNDEKWERADELIDIVNLDACQGKEWDYVILSIVYGPDQEGNIPNNFGALGRDDGMNRLNVMITRAKKQMIVVTSLTPSMLLAKKQEGVRDLRDFLNYAKGDEIFDTRVTKISNEKGIVANLVKILRNKGYEVHTSIGSSYFKVDVGIVSKNNKDRYVLGILIDSFGDRMSDIRDKQIVYPKALEEKGWNIYQLNLLNWYQNSDYEINQIEQRIKNIEGGKCFE